jgi:hypothetical protein
VLAFQIKRCIQSKPHAALGQCFTLRCSTRSAAVALEQICIISGWLFFHCTCRRLRHQMLDSTAMLSRAFIHCNSAHASACWCSDSLNCTVVRGTHHLLGSRRRLTVLCQFVLTGLISSSCFGAELTTPSLHVAAECKAELWHRRLSLPFKIGSCQLPPGRGSFACPVYFVSNCSVCCCIMHISAPLCSFGLAC